MLLLYDVIPQDVARKVKAMKRDAGVQASRQTIAVLPLGAHEYHGPHLPLDTDTLIVEAIAMRLKAALPADLDMVFLDADPIGYSVEHADREGTRSLSWNEAVVGWLDVCENLASSGIRKLILLNAHGGNSPLLTIVATEARARFNMLCVVTSWTRFGVPEGVITPEAKAIDIHGGMIETSVMLALHPERVDMGAARNFPSKQSDFIRDYKHLRAYGPHAFGWKMRDLDDDGAAGDATAATAEKGELLIAHAVRGLVQLVDDVDRFDAGTLR